MIRYPYSPGGSEIANTYHPSPCASSSAREVQLSQLPSTFGTAPSERAQMSVVHSRLGSSAPPHDGTIAVTLASIQRQADCRLRTVSVRSSYYGSNHGSTRPHHGMRAGSVPRSNGTIGPSAPAEARQL